LAILTLTLLKIKVMKTNWMPLGIITLCTIVIILYLVWKNVKDKNKIENSFNEKVKDEKKFKFDMEDEF